MYLESHIYMREDSPCIILASSAQFSVAQASSLIGRESGEFGSPVYQAPAKENALLKPHTLVDHRPQLRHEYTNQGLNPSRPRADP